MIIQIPEGCTSIAFLDSEGLTISSIGMGSIPDSVVLQPHPPKPGTPPIPDSFNAHPPPVPKPTFEPDSYGVIPVVPKPDKDPDSAAGFPGPIPKP